MQKKELQRKTNQKIDWRKRSQGPSIPRHDDVMEEKSLESSWRRKQRVFGCWGGGKGEWNEIEILFIFQFLDLYLSSISFDRVLRNRCQMTIK